MQIHFGTGGGGSPPYPRLTTSPRARPPSPLALADVRVHEPEAHIMDSDFPLTVHGPRAGFRRVVLVVVCRERQSTIGRSTVISIPFSPANGIDAMRTAIKIDSILHAHK